MSSLTTQERSIQLRDVLDAIETVGVAEAVARYGDGLTDAERNFVLTLTDAEATHLLKVASRIGHGQIARDNNIF